MDTAASTPSVSPNLNLQAASFKHRRIGRCPSPPVWGCYELDVSGSDSETGSQSESEDEEGISVIISNEVDPANIPLPPSPIPIVISMDSESAQEPPVLDTDQGAAETLMANDSPPTAADADAVLGKTPQQEESPQEIRDTQDESCSTECGRQKLDKGKGREVVEESPQSPISSSDQQCVPQTPPSRISRRAQRTQRRSPKYQPILTIRSSHGWIWNQDLFIPHYMKDRYISFPPEQQADGPGVEYDCVGITLTVDDLTQVVPP